MALQLCPITYREACDFILQHHLHHLPPQGWKFGIAVADGDRIVGVITVGRPVARALDNGLTLEVTRCCTDGAKNAASMLYSAAWRAAKALGYRRLITFSPHAWGWTALAAGWLKASGARPALTLVLSCDLRATGARAPAGFLKELVEHIEAPEMTLALT